MYGVHEKSIHSALLSKALITGEVKQPPTYVLVVTKHTANTADPVFVIIEKKLGKQTPVYVG